MVGYSDDVVGKLRPIIFEGFPSLPISNFPIEKIPGLDKTLLTSPFDLVSDLDPLHRLHPRPAMVHWLERRSGRNRGR